MQNHPGTFRAFFATFAVAAFLALTLSSCAVTVALPGGGSTTTTPIVQPPNTGTGTGTVTGAGGSPTEPSSSTGENQGSGGPDDGGDSGSNSGAIGDSDNDQGTTTPGSSDSGAGTGEGATDPPAEEPKLSDYMTVPDGYDADWNEDGSTLVLKTYDIPVGSDLIVELPTGYNYKIGDSVFAGQGQAGRIAGIVIPDAVIGIGNYAFQGSWVRQVEIPKSVTQIGTSAFDGAKLKKVTLQGSYEKGTLGTKVFASCDELEEVVFEAPVESLPSGIFALSGAYENTPLKIILPQGLKEIESQAFYYANVKSLFIPATVDKIDESAFDGACIETVYFGGDSKTWNEITENGTIYVSDDVQYNQIPSSILSSESAVEFLEKLFSIFL